MISSFFSQEDRAVNLIPLLILKTNNLLRLKVRSYIIPFIIRRHINAWNPSRIGWITLEPKEWLIVRENIKHFTRCHRWYVTCTRTTVKFRENAHSNYEKVSLPPENFAFTSPLTYQSNRTSIFLFDRNWITGGVNEQVINGFPQGGIGCFQSRLR